MRTSKPVATIAYNSVEFLDAKLAELMREKKIQDYLYIFHHAEEDEKKDHIHLYIEPNKLIDTMDLQAYLSEIDPKHPGKPLRPQKFVFCRNTDTWLLYAEHYPPYLASIFEERCFIYGKEDFRYADENSFDDMYLHAHKGSDWAHSNSLIEQLKNPNIMGVDLLLNGSVPINLATQIQAIERMQRWKISAEENDRYRTEGKLNRNGRNTHTPNINLMEENDISRDYHINTLNA